MEVRLGQGVGNAADVVDLEALVGLVDPPLARLQQGVQVHAAGVLADIISPLTVGKKLYSFDQARWVAHERVEVVGGVIVDEAKAIS